MSTGSKRALVTGASRGLGRALAEALAADGWELIITARGAEALEATRERLAASTRVIAIAGDVASSKHRARLVEAAAGLGGLDAVVNNAGILGPSPMPPLLTYPTDRLEEVLRINVIAPLALLQDLEGRLRDGARIVNVTSDAAVEAYAGWGGYAASKGALEAWSRVLAVENPGLRVYEIDPGDMRTAMHQEAFPGEDIGDRPEPDASARAIVAILDGRLPSGRYRTADVASLVDEPEAA